MANGRNKLAQRCSSCPKNVTSEKPIALVPTLIRWWEALRAPEVAKWQQKYSVDWDATDGRNGGAQRTVWEVLMEMERPKWKGKSTRSRSCGLGPRPSEGIRASQPSSGLGLGRRISAFQGRCCGCCAVTLSTRGVCHSKDVRQSRSRPSRPSCQGPNGAARIYVLCCRMR